MSGMLAGEPLASGRGAQSAGTVEVSKPDSFGCHTVKVRRADKLLTVTTELTIPQIVCVDKNDIRSGGSRCLLRYLS